MRKYQTLYQAHRTLEFSFGIWRKIRKVKKSKKSKGEFEVLQKLVGQAQRSLTLVVSIYNLNSKIMQNLE